MKDLKNVALFAQSNKLEKRLLAIKLIDQILYKFKNILYLCYIYNEYLCYSINQSQTYQLD